MRADQLVGWLERIGVPTGIVSIGAEADDHWCLLTDNAGQPGWEVFWREQGNRYDWARFTSEQVACFYLYGRLAWSQVVRGALGTAPPTTPPEPDASGTATAPLRLDRPPTG